MKQSTPVEQENAMLAAVDELFEGSYDTVTLQNGRQVEIKAAKVKHLRHITEFVQAFVSEFEGDEIVRVLTNVSHHQTEMIAQGSSPYSLNTNELVKKVVGETSIVLRIFNSGVDLFAKLVPLFTSVTTEEFEDLEMDDAATLVFAIFGRNYHFFIQRVLPVIQGSIARRAQTAPPKDKTASAPAK